MIKNTPKSVLISTTQIKFAGVVLRLKPVFESLKSKNIKIKIITQAVNTSKKYINEIKNFAEVKHPDSKSRFVIVDGKEMVFMVMDKTKIHPSYDVVFWVNLSLAKELEIIYF